MDLREQASCSQLSSWLEAAAVLHMICWSILLVTMTAAPQSWIDDFNNLGLMQ